MGSPSLHGFKPGAYFYCVVSSLQLEIQLTVKPKDFFDTYVIFYWAQALMTGSWDKTVKFWDTRSPNPIMNIDMGERVYAADVDYPMAVVGTAGRGLRIYSLENQPKEFKRDESPLKYQHRCISIFRDKSRPTPQPTGKESK